MSSNFKNIYEEIIQTVEKNLHQEINADSINHCVDTVISLFEDNLYNPLLFYFYDHHKDNYLVSHIANNLVLSVAFGVFLKLEGDHLRNLSLCAFSHDLGMKEFQSKAEKSNIFSQEEDLEIRKHTEISAEYVKDIFPEEVLKGIRDIHEFVNGSGYPQGKKGNEISSLAKIIAVCDSFEALTHPRNFRAEFTPYEAIKLIIKKKDHIYDERVVKKFLEFMSIYPIGSLVMLNTGKIGMVTQSQPDLPTRSTIQIIFNSQKEMETQHSIVDLRNEPLVYVSQVLSNREEKEVLSVIQSRGEYICLER